MSRKQLLINIIANIISFSISMVISFFISPYIVNNVGKEAYGFVGLANNFVEYASLITIALNSMGGRFITIKIHKDDIEGANKYFNSILIANIIMGALIMIPSAFIILYIQEIINVPNEILKDVQLLWGLMFTNFIINLISSTFGIATYVKNRLDLSSYLSIKTNLLRAFILIFMFILFKPSICYLGIAAIICTLVTVVYNITYTKKLLPQITLKIRYFDINVIKELISSGIWNTFSKLSAILSNGLDLLIANIFISTSAMGTLSLAKTVPMMIISISGILTSTFSPNLTILYAKERSDELKKELLISMKVLGFIMSIPLAGFFSYGKIFYALWVPVENEKLLYMLSVITILGFTLGVSVETLYNVFTITNKLKANSIFNFVCSVFTALIVFLLMHVIDSEILGIFIIAGVSTIFSIVRSLLFLPLYAAKCLNYPWYTFYKPIITSMLSIIIIIIISKVFLGKINIDSWFSLITCCAMTTFIGVSINYIIFLSKLERAIINNKIVGLIRKEVKAV